VIPIVEGEIRDARCVAGGILLTNFDYLTDGTLAPGNPDLFYGACPDQLDRRIRNELNGRIIPSTQEDLPMAPSFFLAAKGPDGNAVVARSRLATTVHWERGGYTVFSHIGKTNQATATMRTPLHQSIATPSSRYTPATRLSSLILATSLNII
jgi:hypothetical protein